MYVKVITSQTLPHYCLGPGSEYLNRDAPFSTSVSTLIDATFPIFFTPIVFVIVVRKKIVLQLESQFSDVNV